MGKNIWDMITEPIKHAIAVPWDAIHGDFGKIPGDIFQNALDIGTQAVAPGGGSFLSNLATSTALSAAGGLAKDALFGSGNSNNNTPPATPPFVAARDASMALPGSLSQFAGASDPSQASTNIATQGVYGGGEGPDEQKYFLNLINRRLVDDQGQVAKDTSSVNPVEGSYLNQLGLGGYSDPTDLLKKIHGYAAS